MFCINCGQELPDDANFCHKCGKPQKNIASTADETKWETCEIVYSEAKPVGLLTNAQLYFWAKAIGSKGTYNAGKSSSFEAEGSQLPYLNKAKRAKTHQAHDILIEELVGNGWEHIGRASDEWYSYTFRRRIRNSN